MTSTNAGSLRSSTAGDTFRFCFHLLNATRWGQCYQDFLRAGCVTMNVALCTELVIDVSFIVVAFKILVSCWISKWSTLRHNSTVARFIWCYNAITYLSMFNNTISVPISVIFTRPFSAFRCWTWFVAVLNMSKKNMDSRFAAYVSPFLLTIFQFSWVPSNQVVQHVRGPDSWSCSTYVHTDPRNTHMQYSQNRFGTLRCYWNGMLGGFEWQDFMGVTSSVSCL